LKTQFTKAITGDYLIRLLEYMESYWVVNATVGFNNKQGLGDIRTKGNFDWSKSRLGTEQKYRKVKG